MYKNIIKITKPILLCKSSIMYYTVLIFSTEMTFNNVVFSLFFALFWWENGRQGDIYLCANKSIAYTWQSKRCQSI